MAALARELGLTMIPMDDCKLSDSGGRPVAEATDGRIQALWNKVLDECAEKQHTQNNVNDHSSTVSSNDSPGDTSVESHGEGNSSAESEAPEATRVNGNQAQTLSVDRVHKAVPRRAEGGDNGRNGRPHQDSSNPVGKGKARSKENGRLGGGEMPMRRGQGLRATLRNPASLGQVLEETARVHLANLSKAEHELWGWHRGNLEISCGAVSSSMLSYGTGTEYTSSTGMIRPIFIQVSGVTQLIEEKKVKSED